MLKVFKSWWLHEHYSVYAGRCTDCGRPAVRGESFKKQSKDVSTNVLLFGTDLQFLLIVVTFVCFS